MSVKKDRSAKAPANAMAAASLVLGILAVPLSLILIGVIFAGLSMSFALLSRGSSRMSGAAAAGLALSVVSLLPFGTGLLLLSGYAGSLGMTLPYELLQAGLLPFFLGTLGQFGALLIH